jgi:hypothetical protein
MRHGIAAILLFSFSLSAEAKDLADCPPKMVDVSDYEKQSPFLLKFTETWARKTSA